MSYGKEIAIEQAIDCNLVYARASDMASKGMWETRYGKIVRVSEMTDRHILNCLAVLRRGNSPYAEPFICMFEAEQKRRRA